MALLTTIFTVVAMLGGISMLLWLSAYVENRHLGPAGASDVDLTGRTCEPGGLEPTLSVVETAQTAA